jgi:N6-adenosine-specific RNA methylase IME4
MIVAIDVPIAEIRIEGRARRDLGDLGSLATSIAELGLLQPIGIDPQRRLIFGERRLRAFQQLGRDTIPARVIEVASILAAEHAENELRKDFTVSERVAIVEALKREHGIKHGGIRGADQDQNFDLARAVEIGGFGNHETYRQARAVVDQGVPELTAAMDAGRVAISWAASMAEEPADFQRDVVAKIARGLRPTEARRQARHERLPEAPAWPKGKFRVIHADPPWAYRDERACDLRGGYVPAKACYPTLTPAEVCAAPVRSLAADDAVLFLWATAPLLPEQIPVIAAWGFEYRTHFVWDKVRANFGHYHDARHELLLIGVRGSCTPDVAKREHSVITIARDGPHSTKPPEFREMIDRLYPHGPRIELFARGEVPPPWQAWGNEATLPRIVIKSTPSR